MSTAHIPDAFIRRLHAHNLRALTISLLCLVGTILVWGLIYFGIKYLFILFYSVTDGTEATLPSWFPKVFPVVAFSVTAFSILFRSMHRYSQIRDRSILGPHVFIEILLLPAALTFGITDNLRAYQRLSQSLIRQSWQLLCEIYENGKIYQSTLPTLGGNPQGIQAACLLLQLAGLVNLHHSKEDWFYLIPSSEKAFLQTLLPDITPPP
ncbi:MAG: hypothetical protein ACK5LK_09540 [Chthoniobacterales bacterium]